MKGGCQRHLTDLLPPCSIERRIFLTLVMTRAPGMMTGALCALCHVTVKVRAAEEGSIVEVQRLLEEDDPGLVDLPGDRKTKRTALMAAAAAGRREVRAEDGCQRRTELSAVGHARVLTSVLGLQMPMDGVQVVQMLVERGAGLDLKVSLPVNRVGEEQGGRNGGGAGAPEGGEPPSSRSA